MKENLEIQLLTLVLEANASNGATNKLLWAQVAKC